MPPPLTTPTQSLSAASVATAELAEAITRARLRILPVLTEVPSFPVGTDWTITVPVGTVWLIWSVRYVLNTSAVVAQRTSRVQATDGNTPVFMVPPTITVGQNTQETFSYVAGLGVGVNAPPSVGLPLPSPPVPLPGGFTIGSSTVQLDVGDFYSGVNVYAWQAEHRTPDDLERIAQELAQGIDSEPYSVLRELL